MVDTDDGLAVVDRRADGAGWIAHPDEPMQRASHALAVDGEVWVVDPVDAPGVDDLLAEFGEVAGVVVGVDRHRRDAATVATRHDVPVSLPRPLAGIGGDLDAPVELVDRALPRTSYRTLAVVDNPLWTEVALHDPESGTLLVPEAVGTAAYYRAPGERLGVHPALRIRPPRRALAGVAPERLLVGHGAGIEAAAATALDDALARARRTAPGLYWTALRGALGW